MVNGSESSWLDVLSGVPQGSILGPVLFSLFVNDLPGEIQSLISLFADDTKLYLPVPTDEAAAQLAEDLATLERWAVCMQMKFHPLKCKIMHLGRNNAHHDYRMKNEDGTYHTLEETTVEKSTLTLHYPLLNTARTRSIPPTKLSAACDTPSRIWTLISSSCSTSPS